MVRRELMVASERLVQGNLFKAGWILLLAVSVLMTLNHLVLIFALNQPSLFIGWTAFNLYACLVLWFPFRQGERWAWGASWILVTALASAIFFDAQIGVFYLGAASIAAVGLLMTTSAFFTRPAQSAQT
jgi:hypothetical protein